MAHRILSNYSEVLEALTSERLLTKLTYLMYLYTDPQLTLDLGRVMRDRKRYVQEFGAYLAVTQSACVEQLFDMGVRYYHVHLEYHRGRFFVSNSLQGDEFYTYLLRLARSMRRNPGEIVVLHVDRMFHPAHVTETEVDAAMQTMVAICLNATEVTLYQHAEWQYDLAHVPLASILNTTHRLVIVYPRHTRMFWMSANSLYQMAPYLFTLAGLQGVLDSYIRYRDYDRIGVIRAALTPDFTAHVRHYTYSPYDDVYLLDRMLVGLYDSMEVGKDVFSFLKGDTSLKDVIFSSNFVTRNTTTRIIAQNGNDFINNLL